MNILRQLSENTPEEHDSEGTGEKHEEESGHHSDNTEEIIVLIFIILLTSVILKHINYKWKIPYSPLLLIFGIILGLFTGSTNTVTTAIDIFKNIGPHSIMLLFLPPLIFESSFNADWHIFKREIGQILLLAVPGVLIGTFITALVILYPLQFTNFTFSEAVLFGSILSATDPVAVVALLKELGVSKRFATLIEGESLFNDGTAMVVFSVMLVFASGDSMPWWEVIIKFFRLSVGGLLFGVICGWVVAMWIDRLYNHTLLLIVLTVGSSYLVFYVAEMTDLEVSGVLAVVGFGLYLSVKGRIKFSESSTESIHDFWEFCCFIAETLIFVISGLLIEDFYGNDDFNFEDNLKALGLYLMLHIVRFIMCFILWPILRITGYGLTFKQLLVIVYSGLRGAVAIALAMLVMLNHKIEEDIRDTIFLVTADIVICTILINGTTAGFLMAKLGMTDVTPIGKRIMCYLLTHFIEKTDEKILELKRDPKYDLVQWEKVKTHIKMDKIIKSVLRRNKIRCHFDDPPISVEERKRIENNLPVYIEKFLAESKLPGPKKVWFGETATLNPEEVDKWKKVKAEAKHRFLTILKGCYHEQFTQGLASGECMLALRESADIALDKKEDHKLDDWTYVETYLHTGLYFWVLTKLTGLPCGCGNLFERKIFGHISKGHEMTSNFIDGHHDAQRILVDIMETNQETEHILQESKEMVKLAEQRLQLIQSGYFRSHVALENRRAAYALLVFQKEKIIEHAEEMGEISEKESHMILDKIHEQIYEIHLSDPSTSTSLDNPRGAMTVPTCPLVKIFGLEKAKEIEEEFEQHNMEHTHHIYKPGNELRYIYFICSGWLKVKINHDYLLKNNITGHLHNYQKTYPAESIMGLLFLYHTADDLLIDADVQKSFAITYRISSRKLREYLDENPLYELNYWKEIGADLILFYGKNFVDLENFGKSDLESLLEMCKFKVLEANESVTVRRGIILFYGEVTNKIEEDEQVMGRSGCFQEIARTYSQRSLFVAPMLIRESVAQPIKKRRISGYDNPAVAVASGRITTMDRASSLRRNDKRFLKATKRCIVAILPKEMESVWELGHLKSKEYLKQFNKILKGDHHVSSGKGNYHAVQYRRKLGWARSNSMSPERISQFMKPKAKPVSAVESFAGDADNLEDEPYLPQTKTGFAYVPSHNNTEDSNKKNEERAKFFNPPKIIKEKEAPKDSLDDELLRDNKPKEEEIPKEEKPKSAPPLDKENIILLPIKEANEKEENKSDNLGSKNNEKYDVNGGAMGSSSTVREWEEFEAEQIDGENDEGRVLNLSEGEVAVGQSEINIEEIQLEDIPQKTEEKLVQNL